MEKEKILSIQNLSVLMGERFLLKNISFSMEQGDCIGIVGEDKSGKTSLIKAITGSLPISDGHIVIFGCDIQEDPTILTEIALCLDPPVFFKYQTVENNIEYLCSLTDKIDKQKIDEALDKFNLTDKRKKHVFFLSYYERKLMALALAFIKRPKIMILDEPFKGLPSSSVQNMKDYIKELRSSGTNVILSSRDYAPIENLCNRYIFMENRQIKSTLSRKECEKLSEQNLFAFVEVKYPNYCGKLVIEKFGIDVKVLGNKILFEADEDLAAEIVQLFTVNKLSVYKAGYLSKKSERIFANLTPYFKEENS
jgi:ABC-type multidrug transport system ATPase subunit